MKEDKPLFDWGKIKAYLSNRKNIIDITKTLVFYAAIYTVFLVITSQFDISAETVQKQFQGLGLYLIPAFILVQLLASLTPLPDLPFIAAGILFFEPWAAFLLIWCGMWLGTVINFKIARRLGNDYIHKHYPETSNWIDRFAGRYWFETVVIGRTFSLVTYAAGISNLSFRRFALASVFGIIPVALNALLIGLALTSGSVTKTLYYGAMTATLAVAIGFFAGYFRRRWEKASLIKNDADVPGSLL